MSPLGRMPNTHASQTAATSAIRTAHLSPYDVIVLAAVEAMYQEPGRQGLPDTAEVATAARLPAETVRLSLAGPLTRQRLVSEEAGYVGSCWGLTPLGTEVLAELIKRERKGRSRNGA